MRFLVLVLLLLIGSPVLAQHADTTQGGGRLDADCKLAVEPTFPDGKAASEAQMIEGQQAMKAFMAESEEYLECLKAVERSWGEEEMVEQRAAMVVVHNGTVDKMEAVAEKFNVEVRAYKAKLN